MTKKVTVPGSTKKVAPGVPETVLTEKAIPKKEVPNIPRIQDQEFKDPKERKLWIIAQCKKFGATEYFSSITIK